MTRLKPDITPAFSKDVKRLDKKHVDDAPLLEVIELVLSNSRESRKILRSRHKMHSLKGAWSGNLECHVANFGDWLLVWCVKDGVAVFQRTGTHDELFK